MEEGIFTASYKYALLLAIADICIEKGDDSGKALRIPTRELAEKYISYYWRQSLPYLPVGRIRIGGEEVVLRQNRGKQAAIINDILATREAYDGYE